MARLLGAWWTQAIERTEAPDPETLIIHTRWPDPLMPARLASCAGAIVPWTYMDRVGFKAFNERPIGSGPLRFASRSRGDQCVLDANLDYWGAASTSTGWCSSRSRITRVAWTSSCAAGPT